MKRVAHPCAGMRPAQIAAFERIAVGLRPRAHRSTLDALLARGVVEKTERVDDYSVPLPVHAAWCEWCAAKRRG